jgi:hypothetical protein
MMSDDSIRSVLQQDIDEDAYHVVQDMIHSICWSFTRKFGGDYQDWESEANVLFMEAYRSHNPDKAGLITWTWHRLHWGLLNYLRRRGQDKGLKSIEELFKDDEQSSGIFIAPKPSALPILMEHAEESTKELWQLIVEPPEILKGQLDPDDPECSWDALRWYCTYKLQWTLKEMRTAITELTEICSR